MPDGRLSLPAGLRKKHGLVQGGEVIVEDTGDAIALPTLDQVVARAQALRRKLVEGTPALTAQRRWPDIATAAGVTVELIR